MPRIACRLMLEVTSVRVERVQQITEADAIAEGCISTAEVIRDDSGAEIDYTGTYAVEKYEELWNKINGPNSWTSNPFVWVIEFRRIGQ